MNSMFFLQCKRRALRHCLATLTASWVICFHFLTCCVQAEEIAEEVAKFGLDSRTSWTTSRLQGFPDPPPPWKLVPAFPQLKFNQLITLGKVPESQWLLAVEHETGYGGPSRVHQFLDARNTDQTELFLQRPEIIYGFAFHPNFTENRLVYVGCNGRSEALQDVATRVLQFRVEGDGPYRCDPLSEKLIIEWPSNGHNGGDLEFGEHGFLFVSTGDGTSDSDVARNGQNLSTLNGSMLRIDVGPFQDASDGRPSLDNHVSADLPYRIPLDNPFLKVAGARGEIWAYGLRNPWRISYDEHASQLWVGNNGQDLWESAYLIQRGANYGWSIKESNHPFHTEQDSGPVEISPATVEHHHSEARSLTGGHVYRGDQFPELQGAYIYGDYSTGNIWGVWHDGQAVRQQQLLAHSNAMISDFGFDSQGELLVADHVGSILRFEANSQEQANEFPRLLSQTGLFADTAAEIPAPGVIPYSVNSPLWSDGASKHRWLAVPNQETIQFKPRGSWDFPDGSVLVKSFAFPNATGALRRVETRLLAKQQREWFGYSYRWNAEQTDAELVGAEALEEILDWVVEDGQPLDVRWQYPSRSDCMVCHSRAANFVLGLSAEQMNRPQLYMQPNQDRVAAAQLETLRHIGLFGSSADEADFSQSSRLVDPFAGFTREARNARETSEADENRGASQDLASSENLASSEDLEFRARSYIHANCAGCHVGAGGGNSKFVVDYFTPLERAQLVDEQPLHGSLGIDQGRLVAPGSPQRSILLQRISTRGTGQMPPLGSHRVHAAAVELLTEWILSLPKD
ncbi:MAG: PQQ-dependent sugar dehydrogenase [Planctomycetales bacterium]|nr:PQQ-dependent sugar dehydrogenase [Planctomycetales bacterium]